MPIVISCFEPENRPARAQLILPNGARSFCLYLLNDRRHQDAGLRWTALCATEAPPPPESELLMQVEVDSGDEPLGVLSLRPSRLGPDMILEVKHSESVERVSDRTTLQSGEELTLQRDERTLRISIEASSDQTSGVQVAAGGMDAPDDAALADAGAVLWAIPTAAGTLATPGARAATALKSYAKSLRIPPALLMPLLMGGTLLFGMAIATWKNHRRAQDAEGRLSEQEAALASVETQRQLALEGERACLEERGELTKALSDEQAAIELTLEHVFRRTELLTLASALAGERVLGEQVRAFDELGLQGIKALVMAQVPHVAVEASLVAPCLDQRDSLSAELPDYVLLWHPDAALQCPEDYVFIDGQVNRAGRWGLSERAALIYGEGYQRGGERLDDPRLRDAWAAGALSAGLRDTLRGVLMAQTPGRAPVAPSAAALWALALWDAYNHLPLPEDGSEPRSAGDCAAALVEGIARAQTVPAVGQPVLPELAAIARGEPLGAFVSSSECAWPEGSLQSGAARALQAVAREAVLLRSTPDDGA